MGLFALAIGLSLVLARAAQVLVIPALLIGGLLLGPHGLGLLSDLTFLNGASDLGMVLLLFFTSLFTHPNALRHGGRIALPLAAYDLVLNFAAAFWIGSLFGMDLQTRLILAGVMTTSSTGAILKILSDEGRLLRREGNVLVAMLWFEDLAFIGFFMFLSGRNTILEGGQSLLAGAVLFLLFLAAVRFGREMVWSIPQREILIPIVTGVGLVGAFLGTLAGLPAGGAAFTTGLVLAGSRGARFVQKDAPYLREIASAAFFLAFGTLIDPSIAKESIPLAAAAIGGIVLTEFVFLPQVARLLGLTSAESLVLGGSLLARGGKSASFARLGGGTPEAARIQSVSGIMTLVLTPIAPIVVRLILWLRRDTRALQRVDVLGQFSRRVLAPGEYAQRNLATLWERIALTGWFLLPWCLGIMGSLMPLPYRLAPLAAGFAVLPFAYRAIRAYFGRAPGTPGMMYRYRRRALPRVETYLPQLLMGPCLLALVLPLFASIALLAYPILAALTLTVVHALPRLVQPQRSAPFDGVVVRRARAPPRPAIPLRASGR